MNRENPCNVCRRPAHGAPRDDLTEINCGRCGQFSITWSAKRMLELNPLSPRQVANVAGYLREREGTTLATSTGKSGWLNIASTDPSAGPFSVEFARILNSTPPVDQRAARLLLIVAGRSHPGEVTGVDCRDPDLMGRAYAQDADEVRFLFSQALPDQGLVKDIQFEGGDVVHGSITPEGWRFVEALRNSPPPRQPIGFRPSS